MLWVLLMTQAPIGLPLPPEEPESMSERRAWDTSDREAAAHPGVAFNVWKIGRGYRVIAESEPDPETGECCGGTRYPKQPKQQYTEIANGKTKTKEF